MHINHYAIFVELQLHLPRSQFKSKGILVTQMFLDLLDFLGFEGIINSLPKPGISSISINRFLLNILILNDLRLTTRKSIISSLAILPC